MQSALLKLNILPITQLKKKITLEFESWDFEQREGNTQ